MAVEITKLIAAINPDVYCAKDKAKEVKAIAEKEGYLKAAEKAALVEPAAMDFDKIIYKNPFESAGQKNPIEQHKLSYEASDQLLEQVYFWVLDNLNIEYKKGTTKVIDNFTATPGSSFFTEWTSKAQQAQQQAMGMLGSANQVVKSILNLIYDLKDFELRLDPYKKYHSENESEKEEGRLSLKQVWLDQVDIKRGNTSVKALAVSGANAPNFVTLLDAFMSTNSREDAEKADLNEIVKKILIQRVSEFSKWIEISEKELKNRFEIEKKYLKSQVNTLKLYTRWITPYLKAAQEMEQRAKQTEYMANTFNVALFEITALGQDKFEIPDEILKNNLPKIFKDFEKWKKRLSYPIITVELKFRGTPEKVGGSHRYRGKVDITFTSYSLNDDELKLLKELIEKSNTEDTLEFITEATTGSLEVIKEDLEKYLSEESEEDKKAKEKKEEKKSEDVNPFSALFSFFKSNKKEEEKEEKKAEEAKPEFRKIKPDDEYEKAVRSNAIIEARRKCNDFYERYKKAHSMPTL